MNTLDILRQADLADPIDQKLLFDFFIGFSKFESKLVELGYFHEFTNIRGELLEGWSPQGDGWVLVGSSWDKFTSQASWRNGEESKTICKKHLDFMRFNPPTLPIRHRKSGMVSWGYPKGEAKGIKLSGDEYISSGPFNLNRLSVLVRRVRNNLFHGGKFKDPREQTIDRVQNAYAALKDFNDLLGQVGPA